MMQLLVLAALLASTPIGRSIPELAMMQLLVLVASLVSTISTVSFMSNGITMNTSEFELLIAGSTTYNFTGLSNGQTLTIT